MVLNSGWRWSCRVVAVVVCTRSVGRSGGWLVAEKQELALSSALRVALGRDGSISRSSLSELRLQLASFAIDRMSSWSANPSVAGRKVLLLLLRVGWLDVDVGFCRESSQAPCSLHSAQTRLFSGREAAPRQVPCATHPASTPLPLPPWQAGICSRCRCKSINIFLNIRQLLIESVIK